MASKTQSKSTTGEPFRTRVDVQVEFTTEKWKEKTDQLTRRMKDVELQEEEIKAQSATAKALLKTMRSELNDLTNQLTNGYEVVTVPAFVEYNRKKGKKRLLYNAPGKPNHKQLIREEPMSEEDYDRLPLEEQPDPAKGKGAEPAAPQAKTGVDEPPNAG